MNAKGSREGIFTLVCASLASLTWYAGCMADNSLGKDSVSGSGGSSVSATGGASAPLGTGGRTGGPAVSGLGGTGIGGPAAGTGGAPGGGGSGPTGRPDAGADTSIGDGGPTTPPGDGGPTIGPVVAGGDSKCAGSTAKLCDGFEGPAPGSAGSAWTAAVAGGTTVLVDGTKPFRGTKSVHITFAAASNAEGFITETQTFTPTATAAVNDAMWGRAFVWYQLDAGQTAPAGHFVFIRAEGAVAAGALPASSQLHVAGGHGAMLGAEIRTGTDLYKYASPAVPVPQTSPGWQCWEWHTDGSNTLQFYINGNPVPGMAVTATDKWPFPNFSKLYLGWLDFSAGPTGQMWIDEIAVGNTQIGCGN